MTNYKKWNHCHDSIRRRQRQAINELSNLYSVRLGQEKYAASRPSLKWKGSGIQSRSLMKQQQRYFQ